MIKRAPKAEGVAFGTLDCRYNGHQCRLARSGGAGDGIRATGKRAESVLGGTSNEVAGYEFVMSLCILLVANSSDKVVVGQYLAIGGHASHRKLALLADPGVKIRFPASRAELVLAPK